MGSERKASAIYKAVHTVMMDLRVDLKLHRPTSADDLDLRVALAMDRAAAAAVEFYNRPLPPRRPSGE